MDGLGNIMQGKYTKGSGKPLPVRVSPVGAKVTNKVTAEERKELLSRNPVNVHNSSVDKSGESGIIDDESDLKELKKAIADGKLSTKLDKKAQSAHKLGSAEYNKRLAEGYLPSYTELSHMEVQKIINAYSLTGTVRKGKDGQFRETISVKENIGMFGNLKTKKYIPTNIATIHYSKKGAHLVPSAPLGGK